MIAPDDKIVLTVLHNIFLTKDERYNIIEGMPVVTMGISVPVWVLHKTGKSTEPAPEVFCRYKIINDKEKGKSIKRNKKGYLINLPQLVDDNTLPMPTLEEWVEMSTEEKEAWYDQNKKPAHPEKLRDIGDNGAEYLRFEQQRKAKFKNGPYIHIIHWIEIKTIEALNKTLLI